MSVLSRHVFGLLFLFDIINGAIYFDANGSVVTGDNLIILCDETETCKTHFSKNVYATSEPYLDRKYTSLLFPDMYDQFDSDKECGTGSKFVTMGSCAQVHSPYTPLHPEGSLTVKYVESQYALKWQNIRESKIPIYDSFLDNTAATWVKDLHTYYLIWNEMGADIVYLKWKIKNTNKNVLEELKDVTFYSMITHNGDAASGSTLTQYELISNKFSGLTDEIEAKMIESEQRIFFDGTTDYTVLSSGDTCSSYPIGARRAVTDIDANIEWYTKIFGGDAIIDDNQIVVDTFTNSNGKTVKYAHLKLHASFFGTTISLFEREESETYGEFKVKDFENGMNEAHEEFMLNPYCGIDRWFDQHMAVVMRGEDETSARILKRLMESGEKYSLYDECGDIDKDCVFGYIPLTVYMAEPNGHSLQMVFNPSYNVDLYTTPTQWNPDWCELECTEEQATYSYGDTVASFRFPEDDSTDDSDSEEEEDENDSFYHELGLNNLSQEHFNVIYLIAAVFGILLIGGLIVRNKMNTHKYQELPQ